ncbi:enoyl-CoA hydratase domain-containing protein 3, mitochondrial-like isoform X2 [Lingula anatina]|uniref:Enoyl-CoA hydratase domain-containing protein 3, mitochondrial n=1 Tax=Lingula anatina TaxID=7574 RepID=A0A1S3HK76_LINAN|nr:enoyl-CoA hydratase domain-containing protein 3, mitochondrial-like isoform X2 [Lingula anatina]|eukprot:XP_013386518.1 enoyl-CoA hydratase domain-containing protein 3, mitochondrial-like isoform X2 [Lingula anatina]
MASLRRTLTAVCRAIQQQADMPARVHCATRYLMNSSNRRLSYSTQVNLSKSLFRRTLTTQAQAEGAPLVLRRDEGGIRWLKFNNERKRNALSLAMLDCLKQELMEGGEDEKVRVLILTSEGPAFSSGHDLSELTSATGHEYHKKVFRRCTEVMTLVQDIPVPVMAEVRGLATAAGCQLVASCDVAIAAETARFATPGVNIGLFCSTPGVALARAVPRKVAMEMLLTGFPISASEAFRAGLVSKVVPEDKVEEETLKIARKICDTSRSVTAIGKACFYNQIMWDRNTAYRHAEDVMVSNLQIKDGQEGIGAFLQKRHPVWTHNEDPVDKE